MAGDHDELLRVRDHVHELTKQMQRIVAHQAETRVTIQATQTSVEKIDKAVEKLSAAFEGEDGLSATMRDLGRRVTLLERVVFGAVALILTAVLTAWLAGAIIIPGAEYLRQLGIGPHQAPPAVHP